MNNEDSSNVVVMRAADLPNPPITIERLAPTSSMVISLYWPAVLTDVDTGFDLVSGYRLYTNTGIGDDIIKLIFDGEGIPSQRTFTHDGLIPGRYYKYQVSTLNSVGEGPKSTVKIFLASQPPLAPGKPTFVNSFRGGSLTIEWEPPADVGGSVIRSYMIMYNDGESNSPLTRELQICDPMKTVYQLTGLLEGRFYGVAVKAFTSCSEGEFERQNSGACPSCSVESPLSEISTFVVADLPSRLKIKYLVYPNEGRNAPFQFQFC